MRLTALAPTRHFNAPQMAASRGKALSLFRIRLYTGASTWIPTATFLLVVGLGAQHFAVCAPATRRSAGQTPTFDRNTAVNLGGSLVYPGTINPGGLGWQGVPRD